MTADIQVLQVLCGPHSSDVNSVDVTSFGKEDLLVTGSSDQTVRLWKRLAQDALFLDTESTLLVKHNYSVNEVRFSPQGTMVASGSTDGTAIITEPHTGKRLFTFVQPTTHSAIRVCRFSPDSTRLITAGDDETICLWDIGSRSLSLTIKYHDGTIFAADFTPDSSFLISCDVNGVMCLWDCDSARDEDAPLVVFKECHDLGILCCDIAPLRSDEYLSNKYTLATGGNDDVIRLWTVSTGLKKHKIQLMDRLSGHPGACVMSLKFSPVKDSTILVSTGGDKLARLWDYQRKVCLATLNHHKRYVTSSVFLRQGSYLITGSNDRSAIVWDLNNDNSLSMTVEPEHISCEKRINRRNEEMYQSLMNCEFLEATLEASLRGHTSDVNNIKFISNGQFVSCSSDKTVRLWSFEQSSEFSLEIKSEELHASLKTNKLIYDVDYISDSKLLLSSDGKIRQIDEEGVTEVGSLPVDELFGVIRSCKITWDSKFALTGGDDDRIYVWDLGSFEKMDCNEYHEGTIFFIDMLPLKDETYYIVSGCAMGELKYWAYNSNVDQSIQIIGHVEEAHDLGVNCGSFRPETKDKDGHYILATGGNDCLIKIWKVEKDQIQLFKSLSGHGGVVMSIAFSDGDCRQLMVSTSGDKTIRLWEGSSFQILRVLETSCRYVPCSVFSTTLYEPDGSRYLYLATGSNDEVISLWKLCGSLVVGDDSESFYHVNMENWSASNVSSWISSLQIQGFINQNFTDSFESMRLTGAELGRYSESDLLFTFPDAFADNSTSAAELHTKIQWRRQQSGKGSSLKPLAPSYSLVFSQSDELNVPSDLLCPITHEIMVHPVSCSDGFVYEKSAIEEWLISRKRTSPMTNLVLTDVTLTFNHNVHKKIQEFLIGNKD